MNTSIHELLQGWAESERNCDAEALRSLLTDDFVGIGPVGFVLDKQGWLGRMDRGLRYERLELDEVSAYTHGDMTYVIAHQHAVGSYTGGSTFPDLRVSFTVVPDETARSLRIAGMHYSFIGMPGGTGS